MSDTDCGCETLDAARQDLATLRAYAEIVEAVATNNPIFASHCKHCGRYQLETPNETDIPAGIWQHAPDCIYLKARKVRGYE